MRVHAAILALLVTTPGWAADAVQPRPTLRAMLCTQEGVSKGYRGKELDDFVGGCVRAKDAAKEPPKGDDGATEPDTANC
jgi:hypothetical protein